MTTEHQFSATTETAHSPSYGSHAGNGRSDSSPTRRNRAAHDQPYDRHDPSLGSAASHALTAAKGVVADRLALVRAELGETTRRLIGSGVLLVAGATLFILGWFLLSVGAVLAMGVWWGAMLSLPVRLLIATAATAILGSAFLFGGVSGMRSPATTE